MCQLMTIPSFQLFRSKVSESRILDSSLFLSDLTFNLPGNLLLKYTWNPAISLSPSNFTISCLNFRNNLLTLLPTSQKFPIQQPEWGIYVICPSCGQNSAVTSHFTHFKICRKLCYQALPLISIPALLCLLLWVQAHWSPLVFSFCCMWWNAFPPLPQLPQVLVISEFLREAHFAHLS